MKGFLFCRINETCFKKESVDLSRGPLELAHTSIAVEQRISGEGSQTVARLCFPTLGLIPGCLSLSENEGMPN